jgi:hypothetical protein
MEDVRPSKPEAGVAEQRLISVKNAGHYADSTHWKIRRLVHQGYLDGYTLPGGRQLYVSKAQLDALIDNSRGQRSPAVPRNGTVKQ